ncbi:MAG: alkaline phosphatase family protein [Xanthomonadales bacterium]|nr:alkaline phosphatase family protein [Xanthomonadales bacterium]
MTFIRCLACLLLLALAACVRTPPRVDRNTPTLLLVSIDGYRADYLDRGLSPTLAALAADGVRARYMRPSFPSLTFPNHYTLVTGLRPDRNGIVANIMEDERIPGERFSATNRTAVGNPRWWDEATPLWTSVQRSGRRAATMFWPGSEAPVQGRHPDYWAHYDRDVADDVRVDAVLGWLDLPVAERPSFITLYFDRVDVVGHHFGPDSAQTDEALRSVDAALARLVAGLDARGLRDRINLVIVSDHGMVATSRQRVVLLDDIMPRGYFRIVMAGVLTGIAPRPEYREEVEAALLAPHAHMQCHRRDAMPARFHYGTNRRIPPILCLADNGWVIGDRDLLARKSSFSLGEHGYDIDDPQMRAIFVGRGPGLRRKAVIAPFDNVDVYPLLARLLGITPEPGDGDLSHVREALR